MSKPAPVVCILSQSHLCRNPRVLKEALALAQNGYEVHVVTSIYSHELLSEDYAAITGLKIKLHIIFDHSNKSLSAITDRILNKAGRLLVKHLGIQTPNALGYAANRCTAICLDLKAQLYICHQELATYIGVVLLKKGRQVAFDLEDWYSEDLLPSARKERPVKLLKHIEKTALNSGAYVSTTSHALAVKLQQSYGGKLPAVIYNVFPAFAGPAQKKAINQPLKLFWFSQTIGPGRGLEEFLQLSASFKLAVEFHLLGAISDSYKSALQGLCPATHRLHFHSLVPESELPAKIAEFDVGLALESDTPPSRNFTVTNKFFQYLNSGLPVIATNTAGQTEAFEKFKPGFLLSLLPSAAEVNALSDWLDNPASLAEAAERAKLAAAEYNWENQSQTLLKLVADAIR